MPSFGYNCIKALEVGCILLCILQYDVHVLDLFIELTGGIFYIYIVFSLCTLFNTASSTVSEDAEIEPSTVATLALTAIHSKTRLDLIHTWLDLIHYSYRAAYVCISNAFPGNWQPCIHYMHTVTVRHAANGP